jgi:hypothetical protein
MKTTTKKPKAEGDCSPASCSASCLECGRDWPSGTEQAIAIQKRGKCIVCITEAGERICMEPYEFSQQNNYYQVDSP